MTEKSLCSWVWLCHMLVWGFGFFVFAFIFLFYFGWVDFFDSCQSSSQGKIQLLWSLNSDRKVLLGPVPFFRIAYVRSGLFLPQELWCLDPHHPSYWAPIGLHLNDSAHFHLVRKVVTMQVAKIIPVPCN